MSARRASAIVSCALTSCALGAGEPVATMVPGLVSAALALPSARDLGGDTLLGADGERLRFTRFHMGIGAVTLAGARGAAAVFDPSSPPPRYSLCHSGHCHRDDGALISYEDIQLELAGGSAGLDTVVSMPAEAELDLLAATSAPLTRFEPSADLSRARVVRGTVNVRHVSLAIENGAGRLQVELDVDATWSTDLDHDTAEGDAMLSPRVTIALDGLFVDALDPRVLSSTTTVVLDRPDAPGAADLIRALGGTRPTIALSESP